jgi:hypothetical protein
MNTGDNMIETAVRLLHARDFGPNTLTLLKEIVTERRVRDLLVKMLDFEGRNSQKSEDAIYYIMDIAQAMIDFNRLMACLLMAQLYNFADDLYMHDVCNSIDIWIYKNHTPDLQRHLQLNQPSNMDEAMKRHYDGWITG